MFEQIGNLVDDFVRICLRKTKTLLTLGEHGETRRLARGDARHRA